MQVFTSVRRVCLCLCLIMCLCVQQMNMERSRCQNSSVSKPDLMRLKLMALMNPRKLHLF